MRALPVLLVGGAQATMNETARCARWRNMVSLISSSRHPAREAFRRNHSGSDLARSRLVTVPFLTWRLSERPTAAIRALLVSSRPVATIGD